MTAAHGPKERELLEAFERTVTVDVDGLGATCFCHGSPRSDTECVTERTPVERVRDFMAGRPERVVVTAHVHVQYERVIDGIRLLGPGSVGVPYEGESGFACWALLGPGVELRRTPYDLERAVDDLRRSSDPDVERIVGLLLRPPARDDVIADAEERVFAD
jgi:diadenosine tetraphosphatase ApaH/serine/threonine PP2A family protein phosphatase